MTTTARSTKLTAAMESYFAELGRLSGVGGATDERSTYGPLSKLLDAVGATLKPKVFCVAEPVNHGAGHPDFGLYTSKQVQRGRPRKGQLPERGVVEVKSLQWDTRATMVREQVSRYWGRYRLVLVTNLREFDLVGPDAKGGERTLESYRLADSGTEFARRLERPRAFARETGAGLGEYLSRALSHRAALTEPKDLAWLLASYARDGLARVETADDSPALAAVTDPRALNDLYVRFFRMAERRITEKTGQGVVCFISNYSWLDGLSFAGMRERYLEAFDAIRIDCLNGDKYKTGKVAPDGSPDPSIFSTEGDPVGIQVGTAITTLVRKVEHETANSVGFRHLWGQTKRNELTETAEGEPRALYERIRPALPLGLPFMHMAVSECWFDWPALPELFPASFPGVHTGRDRLLLDIDGERLRGRIANYFDPDWSHEKVERRYPAAMRNSSAFRVSDARKVRDALLARGGPSKQGFVRLTYRPFDNRWLYWEADRRLLTAPAPDYLPHVFEGNAWLSSAQHLRKGASEPQACIASPTSATRRQFARNLLIYG